MRVLYQSTTIYISINRYILNFQFTYASVLCVVSALMSSHAPEAFEARFHTGGARLVSLAIEERKVGLNEVVVVDANCQTNHYVILAPKEGKYSVVFTHK